MAWDGSLENGMVRHDCLGITRYDCYGVIRLRMARCNTVYVNSWYGMVWYSRDGTIRYEWYCARYGTLCA